MKWIDQFWADWHRKRREKRLAYWERETNRLRGRYECAYRMADYYRKHLNRHDAASSPARDNK